MISSKNAKPERRRDDRSRLPIAVRCTVNHGKAKQVWLVEISVSGCQLKICEGQLAQGQFVAFTLPGLEALSGVIVWAVGELAGVQFERPLHEAVLRHLLYEAPPAPLANAAPRDQFGRRLPEHPPVRRMSYHRSC